VPLSRSSFLGAQFQRGLTVAMQLSNSDDGHLYQAAEDAFTSEGGHLAPEDEVLDQRTDASRTNRHLSLDFSKAMKCCAAGVRAVLKIFQAVGSRHAARSTHPTIAQD
jgi:hypothetical protein